MNKIIYKPLLLLFIVLAMNAMTRLCFTDYSWGNEQFQIKRNWLLRHKDKYNTLFIGSSLTRRHVIPTKFDSLAAGGIHSFNLGIGLLSNPESYYLARKLLENDSIKMSFVFMELHEVLKFKNDWYTMKRFYYWMDSDMYRFVTCSVLESGLSREEPEELRKYTLHRLEYILNTGMTADYLKSQVERDTARNPIDFEGYCPMKYMSEEDINKYEEKISERGIKWAETYKKGACGKKPNRPELQMALKMIKLFDDHGIHLVFILNPRQNVDKLSEKLALFDSLPSENKIDLADPVKYPELFKLENAADLVHYNPKGAAIFTTCLAEAFNELSGKYSFNLPISEP